MKLISLKKLLEYPKFSNVAVGIVIAIFAVGFFAVKEYVISFFTIALLIPILKLKDLKRFGLGKDGLETEYVIPEENIRQDIEDNKLEATQDHLIEFRKVEERVLFDVHREIGGEMKEQIGYVYGEPDRPEFSYRPDATIRTDDSLIFIEIKYVLDPKLAPDIVSKATQQLAYVLAKLRPSAGKPLVAKLVLVSAHDLSEMNFEVPEGIELKLAALPIF